MKNGFKSPKTPTTAKAMKKRMEMLEQVMRRSVYQIGLQLQRLQDEIMSINQTLRKIDCRSLATLRMLEQGEEFTVEAHDRVANEINTEIFEKLSEEEDAQLGLVSIDEPCANGHRIVMQLAAYQSDESGKRGDKIDELSLHRSKIQLGAGEFPEVIESEIVGMEPDTTREFTVTMPAGLFPDYADKQVTYEVNLLQVLAQQEQETAPVEQEAAD
jgi:hypothetical protein